MSWYREEYLKSEDWKNLRKAILIYQDYICECCGGVATDVHHLNYRKIWDVTHFDLMAACRSCHDMIHEYMEKNPGKIGRRGSQHKKMGLGIRGDIANKISPRGYVEFRGCFGWSPKSQKRVKIMSRKLRKQIRDQARLDKSQNSSIGVIAGRLRADNKAP